MKKKQINETFNFLEALHYFLDANKDLIKKIEKEEKQIKETICVKFDKKEARKVLRQIISLKKKTGSPVVLSVLHATLRRAIKYGSNY
jgi:Mg2+ and Co2+ transporter CorA